ncbi:FadR/GntR family transcriptional regulator [Frigidibacter sp. MR17.24]|uniref:FadR/GntR family transcriptional regulator n=1 Tax=Frigidibacter sp. MR17.24 TaxID=3127345 RepID=UPI003012C343
MPYQKVDPEKLAQAVQRQIERLVLEGILRPGERLPAERELAERLGVSRPSLREALAALAEDGLIETRPGAGAYVADVLGSAFSPALVRLFARHDAALFDYLDFRRDLEGMTAARAAESGSATDLSVIAAAFARMEAPGRRSAEEDAAIDAQFHMAIVEAAHNVVMLHMMRSMYDLLTTGVFYNRQIIFRQKQARATLMDQHRAINTAIQARDPLGARIAVETHMDYVRAALEAHRRAEAHEVVARLRLAHEAEKD